MSDLAKLVMPAVRWDPRRGYSIQGVSTNHSIPRGSITGPVAVTNESIEPGVFDRNAVGGFIFFGGTSEAATSLVADLRARSAHPIFVAADMERGAGQQFAGAAGLPPLGAIGRLGDSSVTAAAARLTAREARSLGLDWSFAPVVDLDAWPDNPIVGSRSPGADPAAVAEFSATWIEGCQRERVLACAKHFPGHGRTTRDSHAELPVVDAEEGDLVRADLVPFARAIGAGVASIMTAHVAYPALDPTRTPATLSRRIITGLLRERLGFDGLVVTDALIMDGVGTDDDIAVRAIAAGCDLLLYPRDVPAVVAALESAVRRRELPVKRIDDALERRARWIAWAAQPPAATRDAGPGASEICDRAVTHLRGPLPGFANGVDLAIVDDDIGGPYPPPSREPLQQQLTAAGIDVRSFEPRIPSPEPRALVVALFGDIRSWKGRPGYSEETAAAVERIVNQGGEEGREALVLMFSHPRLAAQIPFAPAVVCAWGGERAMQLAAARWLASRR